MLSKFFIDRPIFAAVISIAITLAGAIAAFRLPIAQYPPIAPPTVQVDCNYPGASAEVVAETVAAPIEQQVNGVENMMYMASQSTSDGSYTLTVTFKPGSDLNVAQVLVQNRVSLAMPQLPDVVRQTGITTKKRSPDILLTVSLFCSNSRYDQLYLSNYAFTRVRDELARLAGISEVLLFGQRDFSMRVWLDPDRLAGYGLTAGDVIDALSEQNYQVALGQIGQSPNEPNQALQIPMTVVGRLRTPEEFGNVVLRVSDDHRILYLKNVARIQLGARSQDVTSRFDLKPTVGLAVFQLPNANALETADDVKNKMAELSKDFPEGVRYEVGYDTTPFIRESIREVFNALRDAIILVAIVVLVFLQGWRPAIIPLIAVPVAVIGTFAAMALVGFSLNNLTLFGLVLAIGIVVDDAIVVVEAVEHHIEQGMAPRAAALAAMSEVSGPVIAVGLVLSSVFVPCAFVSGLVGQFFRQFALTIAISTILSMINSLTLSPALAALLLRPRGARRDVMTWIVDLLFGWLFRLFDRGFRLASKGYTQVVAKLLRVPALVLLVYGGLLVATYWEYTSLPSGFIPAQDKGYLIASLQLPDAASVGRTKQVMKKLETVALATPGVKNVHSVSGNSFVLSAYGSNFGSMFIILKNFSDRPGHDTYSETIVANLKKRFQEEVPEAQVAVFAPPAVSGLGRAGGFKFMVEGRGEVDLQGLQDFTNNLVAAANKVPGLTGLFTIYNANSPQLFVDIDRDECQSQGVNLHDVFLTLQGYLGSRYVNDFNLFGRTWQVVVQADAQFRSKIEDLQHLKVRNAKGDMMPLASIAKIRMTSAPLVLTRYNMHPAAAINGGVAPGYSSGQAIESLEATANRELPNSMGYEWTEITYLERLSANTGMIVFGLSVVFVFLVLAALYESWSLPLAVILVVPMCVLSAVTGIAILHMDINILTQVGLIVLIGLACKNAILIVEFAKYRREEGVDARTATLAACALRLRPIIMTSVAFILGVLPLVFAHGAGAEMRQALGVAVFYGMLGVTLFGIFLTPIFFFVIENSFHSHAGPIATMHGWFDRGSGYLFGRLGLKKPFKPKHKHLPSPTPPSEVHEPARLGTVHAVRSKDATSSLAGGVLENGTETNGTETNGTELKGQAGNGHVENAPDGNGHRARASGRSRDAAAAKLAENGHADRRAEGGRSEPDANGSQSSSPARLPDAEQEP
ncbi:MAG TPA: multidrug efflux RND transporter permease subunit [Pirellulales bacterium]|nr:multidrug efflux RND transporter permease subunit [Pirellulales bacterium]